MHLYHNSFQLPLILWLIFISLSLTSLINQATENCILYFNLQKRIHSGIFWLINILHLFELQIYCLAEALVVCIKNSILPNRHNKLNVRKAHSTTLTKSSAPKNLKSNGWCNTVVCRVYSNTLSLELIYEQVLYFT